MNNLTSLEIIFMFLYVTLFGLFVTVFVYVIYNIVSIRAMEKADTDEDNDEEEEDL